MPVIFIRHIGANLAYVEPVGAVDPGFGGGRPGGADPDYGHPIFGPHPGHGLPGSPGHPGNALPGMPGDTLPVEPPGQVNPGEVLILVRDPEGVWHYHAMAPGSPPPRPVPTPPTYPTGGPIAPPVGSGPGHPTGQPVPPMPAPTRR